MKATKVPGAPSSRFRYHVGVDEIDPLTGALQFNYQCDIETFCFIELWCRIMEKAYFCSLSNDNTDQVMWIGKQDIL